MKKKHLLLAMIPLLAMLLFSSCLEESTDESTDMSVNEYGFYFDVGYTAAQGNEEITLVFSKDGNVDYYMNGILQLQFGEVVDDVLYKQGTIEIKSGEETLVLTVSDDGEALIASMNGEEVTFKLDKSFVPVDEANELNEYGFYFNRAYSLYSTTYVFKADGQMDIYKDCILVKTLPAGYAQYFEGGYIYIPSLDDRNVFVVGDGGKTLDFSYSKFYYIDAENVSEKNEYGFYYNVSYKDANGEDEKIFTAKDNGVKYTYENGSIKSFREELPNPEYYTVMGDGKLLLRTNLAFGSPRSGFQVDSEFQPLGSVDYSGLVYNEYGFCSNVAYTGFEGSESLFFSDDGTVIVFYGNYIECQGSWTYEDGKLCYTLPRIMDGELSEDERELSVSEDGLLLIGAWGDCYFADKSTTPPEAPRLTYIINKERTFCVINGLEGNHYSNMILTIPSEIEGVPVTKILPDAFTDLFIDYVKLPDTVEAIGSRAFSGCQLRIIVFGNGLKTIGNYAFEDCNLGTVVLPDSVEKIGECAFYNSGLREIRLSNKVKEIGMAAFSNCRLQTIVIPASVETMKNQILAGNADLTDIYCEAPSTPNGWFSYWAYDYPMEINGSYVDKPLDATIHWGFSEK